MTNIWTTKKKKLFLFITIFVLFLVALSIYNHRYTISIDPNPKDALIQIDDQTITQNQVLLRRGTHSIIATHPRYKKQEREFMVPAEKRVGISLVPLDTITYDITPYSTEHTGDTPAGIIGVDKASGNLVRTLGEEQSVIYAGHVDIWDYNHPWISLIDKNRPAQITILDTTNNLTQVVRSPSGNPVDYATTTREAVYFLTNANNATRKVDLYAYSLSQERYYFLIKTNTTKLRPMLSDQLLLLAEADGNLATICTILDLNDNSEIESWTANKCLTNKDGGAALIDSDSVYLYQAHSKQAVNTKLSGNIAWAENRPLVVVRGDGGVLVYDFSDPNNPSIQKLPISTYQIVVGASAAHLTLMSPEGIITSYKLD